MVVINTYLLDKQIIVDKTTIELCKMSKHLAGGLDQVLKKVRSRFRKKHVTTLSISAHLLNKDKYVKNKSTRHFENSEELG